MLSGVVVGTQLGVSATVLLPDRRTWLMNIAAFAVVVHAHQETRDRQRPDQWACAGLGKRSPAAGMGR